MVFLAEMEAFEHRILAAQEKQADALGAAVLAFGDPPRTEPARNAVERTVLLRHQLVDLLAIVEEIRHETNLYNGEF